MKLRNLSFRSAVFLPALLSFGLLVTQVHSAEEIPVGTVITKGNWEDYKEFMPEGMQVLFRGEHHWKVPDDGVMEVGPTISIPLTKKFVADTEEFSKGVTLKAGKKEGTLIPDGYIAGQPFPDPQEPNRGTKVFYNMYYRYVPYVQYIPSHLYLVDRFDNVQYQLVISTYHKLSGVSDVGRPHKASNTGGIHRSGFSQVHLPEQSKYTTQLIVHYDDPNEVEGNYVFIPSLRRALRLSSAARCSPLLGTDWTPDDARTGFDGVATDFIPEFIAEKKILAMVHLSDAYTNVDNYHKPSFWPKPATGKWELRDALVIDIKPSPEFAKGYCYSRRITYIDKETSEILWVDLYDRKGQIWKILNPRRKPTVVPGTDGDVTIAPESNLVYMNWDVQNEHISCSIQQDGRLNHEVPAGHDNIERYAFPTGLNEVMR